MKEFSIYIHIPFCESRCIYCDFTSFVNQKSKQEAYVDALLKEMEIYGRELKDQRLKTVFIGGGTPSILEPELIVRIMEGLRREFRMDAVEEITIEANPGTITREKAEAYREAGIDRVSLGAQSFNNEILRKIGRIHNSEDIYGSIDILRQAGFKNINLDLMFNLPYQTEEDAMDSLRRAVELDIDHISNYSLIVEESTELYRQYLKGEFQLLDDYEDRKIYHKSCDYLKEKGYDHYEISNFAKKGYRSRHNLVYWNIEAYIGLGVASHSNIAGERYSNSLDLDSYIESLKEGRLPRENIEPISREEEISEYCIMGFRKIEGIDTRDFKERFKEDFHKLYRQEIEKNKKLGLIDEYDGRIFLTKRGLDLSNQVELDFF